VLLAVLLAVPFDCAVAEEDRELLYSLGYAMKHRLSDRNRAFVSTTYEEKYAAGEFFGSQNEFDLDGGLVRDLKDWIRVEGGLGYYYIYRREVPASHEVRLWQSGTLDWPESLGAFRRYIFHHRFRLEERFRANGEDWSFAFRFRYRLAYAFPINRYTVEPGAFFIPTMIEAYVPLGDDIEEFFAQQIRFTLGIGYVFDKVWKGELRYAWQRSRDTLDQELSLQNHYVEFRLSTAIGVRDLLKAR
jgi:hypothetical protein